MKDYLEEHYGDEKNPGYNALRAWVKEAWEALPDQYWQDLLATMHDRMQAMIDANGLHTKY